MYNVQCIIPQTCLLDRFRVVKCEDGELGYHIFYQMIEGSDDSLRRELQLGPRVTESNAFLPSLTEVCTTRGSYCVPTVQCTGGAVSLQCTVYTVQSCAISIRHFSP